MIRKFTTKKYSPLQLVNGIYNPPQAMSKRTAERWSTLVQQKSKGTSNEKRNLNEFIAEKCHTIKEEDHNKTLVEIVSKKFGLDPPTARLKILNNEIWVKDSMHAKYTDIKPKAKISCGDTVCAAVKKHIPAEKVVIKETIAEQPLLKNQIIYKDERIIVINKWDIPVHGGSKHNDVNLEELFPSLVNEGEPIPKIVHRLDKSTTGCMILARTTDVATELANRFQSGDKITKRVMLVNIVYSIRCTYSERSIG
jgi:23S rRNA-/tRNA-specific pseudouridylate synthase